MKLFRVIRSRLSFMGKYHFRWLLVIAVSWTTIDVLWNRFFHISVGSGGEHAVRFNDLKALILRGCIVFGMSSLMGFMLLFRLREAFRNMSLLGGLLLKTAILLVAAVFLNFLLHFSNSVLITHMSVDNGLAVYYTEALSAMWLLHHSLGWVVLFLLTQFAMEFYEKYSPGVFWSILIGRYIHPKVERRIVLFLDLIDSTPTAEQLNSQQYFSFIRDFIYFVSVALLEYKGRIYQYVGDEVIASWPALLGRGDDCIRAVRLSEKLIRRNSRYFRKTYGYVPEFRVGIHAGEVTVGEIGIIKKDLVMSGDTMNTTARIRETCTDLNHNYLFSKEFLATTEISWPAENIGIVELRGKNEGIELYALKP